MTVKPSWALETTVLAVEQVALLFRTNGLSTLYGISVVNEIEKEVVRSLGQVPGKESQHSLLGL